MANTGTVVYKQPDQNITMHMPQSAASNIAQQNETRSVIPLNINHTKGFIHQLAIGAKLKDLSLPWHTLLL
jgi:hypothetical protein